MHVPGENLQHGVKWTLTFCNKHLARHAGSMAGSCHQFRRGTLNSRCSPEQPLQMWLASVCTKNQGKKINCAKRAVYDFGGATVQTQVFQKTLFPGLIKFSHVSEVSAKWLVPNIEAVFNLLANQNSACWICSGKNPALEHWQALLYVK